MQVSWKKAEVEEIEKKYSSLDLAQEQRDNIKFYGDFVAKFIPLSSMVIQGIFSFSIRDWEQAHPGKNFVAEARGPNGLEAATKLNKICKEKIKALVRDPADLEKVENAFDQALKSFAELGAPSENK
ncbi:MAG: hypothetical protein ACFFCV_11465 [Promethearchaeota archaeon]